jgi:enediyne biosynthesis protein E4
VGAAVRLVHESGLEQHGFVSTASSYLSASDKRLHFGLGSEKQLKLVEIRWPTGTIQKLENVKADQILNVREPIRSAQPPAK